MDELEREKFGFIDKEIGEIKARVDHNKLNAATYNKGLLLDYIKPMKEDIENLKRDGIAIMGVQKDIEYIKKSVDDNKNTIKDFIESADKKYASKIVERVVYGMVGLMLITVIGSFMNLIIN